MCMEYQLQHTCAFHSMPNNNNNNNTKLLKVVLQLALSSINAVSHKVKDLKMA